MPLHPEDSQNISLNKYISSSGYCSRRAADKIIKAGRVTINGKTAQSGNRVGIDDKVLVDGNPIVHKEPYIYLAFNKPVGITCTAEKSVKDNIIDFINYPRRIFHVGRLDKDSEGLILLTNDGEIVNKVLRAGNKHEKEYIVRVNKKITDDFIKAMRSGIPVLDTITNKCFVKKESNHEFRIILTQGLNRQIRRMCEYLGYKVKALQRIRIMHIKLDTLPVGKWRHLNKAEVTKLKNSTEHSKKTTLQKQK
ncbi:MAG: 23S rRNA pseudouridine(2604) synthase RluF [Chitinophagales bacterium]